MADKLVELDGVWVWLGDALALKDVTMSIDEGRLISLMGPNGGGKTTLLKVIAGLLEPDRGRVRFFKPEAGGIGYVPQQEAVDPEFPVTARDTVEMGLLGRRLLFPRTTAEDRRRIDEALEMVGMQDRAWRRIGELSGGEKQRVFIARAIVGRPRLLLLDEPTTGVDAAARDSFHRLITDLMQDLSLTIILASHDLGVVPGRVDEIVCINREVFVHAAPEEVEPEGFRRAYGCEMEFMMHGRVPHRVIEDHGEGHD
jgi:zinc transport system ATP-binding protein